MTNLEKYVNTIINIHNQDSTVAAVAMDIRTGVLRRCSEVDCEHCKFSSRFNGNRRCEVNLVRWLFSEYQEPAPKLTKAEKGFCEILDDGYIARDKNGDLYIENNWGINRGYYMKLCSKFFPFITWESGKAWSIEDLLKLEVVDE